MLPFSRSLVAVVGVIAAGKRLAAWLIAYLVLCLRIAPEMRPEDSPLRATLVKPLVRFGGWMTVANVINPIMVQMDRFLIGALLSTAAVAYYTTPYELVTKYWFLSNSVLAVIFPAFATRKLRAGPATDRADLRAGCQVRLPDPLPARGRHGRPGPELLALWLGDGNSPDRAPPSCFVVLPWVSS